MSIYISLATLNDEEIINTIGTALSFAHSPQDISVGVAFMTDIDFYSKTCEVIKSLGNVHYKRFDPKKNSGVGIGRYNSRFAYNGEDYILQVDSHTNFEKNWDLSILKYYNEALDITKNDKTIITAYLGKYRLRNKTREIVDRRTRYSFFTEDQRFYDDVGFTSWQFFPLPEILRIKDKYVPSNKFNANFAFGNYHFANHSGLPKSCIFYDEEIIQSINLLDSGYSLVFPNLDLPLQHLYTQHSDESRETVAVLFRDIAKQMKNNFNDFVDDKNNKEKCLKYQEYARYSLRTSKFDKFYIPDIWMYSL